MTPFTRTLAASPILLAGFGDRSLSDIVNIILALLIAIDVHELGHALSADWLGDDTPRAAGHISLNPFRHMDQFGILLLFLSSISGQGFTYGFTPVNESNLRRRSQFAPAIVALAGPLMNLLLAAVLAVVLTHDINLLTSNDRAFQFVWTLFGINVFLAVFNLVPLPPLDGWAIVQSFMSARLRFDLRTMVRYGPFVLLILIIFEPQIGFFSSVIYPATDWVSAQLFRL